MVIIHSTIIKITRGITMKKLICILLLLGIYGCAKNVASSNISTKKTLDIPDIEDIDNIEAIYFLKGFEPSGGGDSASKKDSLFPPFYYDLLSDAKYVKKMDDNKVIDSANVVITIHENDGSKRVFTVYKKDDVYYLEDNDNLDLYTCDSEIFEKIKKNSELQVKAIQEAQKNSQ